MPEEGFSQLDLATTWLMAARAMVAARGDVPRVDEAAGGLYAQAILGLSETVCLEAKCSKRLAPMTLVDCLGGVRRMPSGAARKILTGVMMIAYANRRMDPLEVRWASMLASAAGVTADEFQRCCASARVIASMLRPRTETPEPGTHDPQHPRHPPDTPTS